MPNIRDNWKAFKKNHPSFEQNQKNKRDLGPHLDAFEKIGKEFFAHRQAMEKTYHAAMEVSKSVLAALEDYRRVVQVAAKTDKSIGADFDKVGFGEINKRIDAMHAVIMVLAKSSL